MGAGPLRHFTAPSQEPRLQTPTHWRLQSLPHQPKPALPEESPCCPMQGKEATATQASVISRELQAPRPWQQWLLAVAGSCELISGCIPVYSLLSLTSEPRFRKWTEVTVLREWSLAPPGPGLGALLPTPCSASPAGELPRGPPPQGWLQGRAPTVSCLWGPADLLSTNRDIPAPAPAPTAGRRIRGPRSPCPRTHCRVPLPPTHWAWGPTLRLSGC